ncbi:threonylcarbamoyl-AMP synthase [Sphingorhabdus lutea]|uniref:Threonylcarbamoyl-AMP synthase n=1 Tax=Sphingorhabdus lutea TaxID=1913578 RepID=A0A1L3JAZ9_9SPHN|nr:L-threonylcarbamoyladenylate synthase [Sphingorhabdus lutea]APG62310.1 threonylcarbamoyl-AMP synthase [Sphingorhabdus lutea]
MQRSNPQGKSQIFSPSAESYSRAVNLLRNGALVAAPTETVYGLAANAKDDEAVAAIYRAKGRPDFNPLIVHVPDMMAAQKLADFNPIAEKLAEKFWPGPLTIVAPLRHDAGVAAAVTAGLPTIAIRCPAHPVMQTLLRQSGLYLAAPSANKSGGISPTCAAHVDASLGQNVDMILDGGNCERGLESTIIRVIDEQIFILREGPITRNMLLTFAPVKIYAKNEDGVITAPGQLSSHYAPNKPLKLHATSANEDEFYIGFGKMKCDENLSVNGDMMEAAANLYAALHRADASEKNAIAIAPIFDDDIGAAINDRLQRAAAPR